ncbi:hypothetical protein NGF19_00560 [Streptomyces sp. RY43-2]|uniref:Uncharacterized protein n=1 Tax=Streptomyces macrolidinus TaxID=2952607 RepID=A0ABT0Z7Y0_9ACTN|nr:hypothetical protein [Streptomyces macrolidinus]MCN9239294.1 hypothetical protein [Streptomyces macrolidinus]
MIAIIASVLGRSALKSDGQDVSLTPASPAPGGEVRLTVRGCPGTATTGTATSDAFVTDARLVGKNGTLTGDTVVRAMLAPGSYAIKADCGGHKADGTLTVDGATASGPFAPTGPDSPAGSAPRDAGNPVGSAPTGPDRPAAPSLPHALTDLLRPAAPPSDPASRLRPSSPTAPASPVAPVHAGGGGARQAVLSEAEEARDSSGPGAREAVIGLVLVSIAAGVVVVRGVRRSRGKE